MCVDQVDRDDHDENGLISVIGLLIHTVPLKYCSKRWKDNRFKMSKIKFYIQNKERGSKVTAVIEYSKKKKNNTKAQTTGWQIK